MNLEKYIAFIEEIEKMKSVLRTSWTSSGRRESDAEHSWRLALLACVISEEYKGLDLPKLLIMSLIHDIGEIYEGDISAALELDKSDKYDTEYRAVQKVFSILPEGQAERMLDIWLEYNANETPEAKLVKALDKAETILQHNQGNAPEDFDYGFNLAYGKEYFKEGDILIRLRSYLDQKTKERMQ
ncbi:MAG TPA: HD domain-containing protein [Clostridiales bacterium]|nr:HD domain-containing protein [Clostridiales bacterium]